MQFIVCRHVFHVTDLEGLVPGLTVANPKHGVAQIAFAFAVVKLDSPGNARHTGRCLVFRGLEEPGSAAFQGDQHLVAPSDGGFQVFGLAAQQLMLKLTAAFFAAADYPDLKPECIGFRDMFNFFHTTSRSIKKQ